MRATVAGPARRAARLARPCSIITCGQSAAALPLLRALALASRKHPFLSAPLRPAPPRRSATVLRRQPAPQPPPTGGPPGPRVFEPGVSRSRNPGVRLSSPLSRAKRFSSMLGQRLEAILQLCSHARHQAAKGSLPHLACIVLQITDSMACIVLSNVLARLPWI